MLGVLLPDWMENVLESGVPVDELIALVISWIFFAIIYFRKQRDWKKRRFYDKVNFSLNEVIDGKLTMRTLDEKSASDVWMNDLAVQEVLQAAKKTTVEDPFIDLEESDNFGFIKRCVLNNLSVRFAEVYVGRSVGLPVKTKEFVFGVTCEKYPDIRKHKVRVMVIAKDTLEKYFNPEAKDVWVDDSGKVTHRDRLKTLQAMGSLWSKKDEDLGVVELGATYGRA